MSRNDRRLSSPAVNVPVRHALPALLVVALAGCASLAPDYQRPAAPVAEHWPGAGADAGPSARVPGWSALIADPRLRELVQLALAHNRDLRVAALNIEKARAQYRIQRADVLPTIAAGASETAQRTPDALAVGGQGGVSRSYGVEVGISTYELDLFGRIRSLKDEALQQYLASEETRRATRISLMAEVAGSYLALAADGQLKVLAERTLDSREQAYALQQDKARIGTGSELELRQALGELEAARVEALTAAQQVQTDRNALELLLGMPLPERLLPPEGIALDAIVAVDRIPAGLPSDLLRNRPDILAAEHSLMAANADIGAARAAFFPSISLTASTGTASDQLSGLFDSGSRSWSFVPQVSLPIFNGGRLRAQLAVSKADRDIAVASYEKSIQSAFREVADALAEREVVDRQLQAQQRREVAAEAAFDLVQQRYEVGVSSYLDVLDAQRTLYAAQQAAIQTQLARETNLVTLYKVLGGGEDAPELANGDTSEPRPGRS